MNQIPTREAILSSLKEILVSSGNQAVKTMTSLSPDARLNQDLGMTSIAMLYTVIAIEECFDIRFGSVGMNDFHTVLDVVVYIEERLSEKARSRR